MGYDIAYILGLAVGNILFVIPAYFIVNKFIKKKNGLTVAVLTAVLLTILMGPLGSFSIDNSIIIYIEILVCLFANRYFESEDKGEVKNESKGA